MAITFLKSIFTGIRNKLGNIRHDRTREHLVKSFKEDQEKEEAFDYKDRGVRLVPVKQIIGSVGRYNDFDSEFRLKQHMHSDRFHNIIKAMKSGKALPPVKLYQIKDEYYVLDGNHRIAAAKELGRHEIDAKIVEFIPSSMTLDNILYRERIEFNETTQLPYTIDLTEVGQYGHMMGQISKHLDFLNREAEEPMSFESAANDWYETIYRPLTNIIEQSGLIKSFPERTLADVYAYISTHQWDQGRTRKYGSAIDRIISDNMEEFRKKMANTKETEYPEMTRGITAFILINVKAKSEYKIMDKLFALKEVQEVHSVHGEIDLLVKIMLTRDLLSSDAEMIGEFVHNNVRSISGVTSTVTLIPGASKMKQK
ncbi:MAG: Lrp/AsnC ligand binding domain-containing protein [Desulfobacterales bacterium]|nr:MAG: Lrp/AsnC ligand binding domain-containing protein [Desulfobacterales bacterium]UCD91337.1 MAG: Lrp/AsnC ligand binding domain-containing protein [Desulfobacterales bacterium]